jgi:hypothetical protein
MVLRSSRRSARSDTPEPGDTSSAAFDQFAQGLLTLLQEVLGDTQSKQASPPAADLDALRHSVQQQQEESKSTLEQIASKLEILTQSPAAKPVEATEQVEEARSDHCLHEFLCLLVGEEMLSSEEETAHWQALAEEVYAEDRTATTLGGQMLLVRAAPRERMPQLLKDLGEAFYQWFNKRPDDSELLHDSMIQWINNKCEQANIPNTVEAVHVGDRFDHIRHNSDESGNEVVEVLGWVVTRKGAERPYAKAKVSVR